MQKKNFKRSLFARIRNYFIAGVVVLIPIGITLYLTLFFIRITGKIIPKEINPNNYLPFNIPGVEILIALIFISLIGWLSLSFIGKKFFELFNNVLKKFNSKDYLFCYWSNDTKQLKMITKKCSFT